MKNLIEESSPGCIRSPWVILIDKAEKSPFVFNGIRSRSFVDKELRIYDPVRTERRYLGIGMGDYSIDGFQEQIAIERKSADDFRGTLLGWPVDADDPASAGKEIDRRGRFKRELRRLQRMENKAVVVEATLGECLDGCPQWGARTAEENAKYLYSTFLAWSQEFAVPWYFLEDKQAAAVTAFRIMEKFWDRHRKEHRQRMRERAAQPLLSE